jgi:hypothetical protein
VASWWLSSSEEQAVDSVDKLKRSLKVLKWMLVVLNILTFAVLIKTFEVACKVGAL